MTHKTPPLIPTELAEESIEPPVSPVIPTKATPPVHPVIPTELAEESIEPPVPPVTPTKATPPVHPVIPTERTCPEPVEGASGGIYSHF